MASVQLSNRRMTYSWVAIYLMLNGMHIIMQFTSPHVVWRVIVLGRMCVKFFKEYHHGRKFWRKSILDFSDFSHCFHWFWLPEEIFEHVATSTFKISMTLVIRFSGIYSSKKKQSIWRLTKINRLVISSRYFRCCNIIILIYGTEGHYSSDYIYKLFYF